MKLQLLVNTNIYLINLDRDTERLNFMTTQMSKRGLSFDRIRAIHGLNMPDWLKPYFLTADGKIASTMEAGEVGCYASHLTVLKQVAQGNCPALILEDDVEIAPEVPAMINAIISMPFAWDIVRLSNASKRLCPIVEVISNRHALIRYSRVPNGTGAYLITPKGAAKFVEWKIRRILPFDHDLARVWETKIATFGIYPRPVDYIPNHSSIDDIGRREFKIRKASKHLPFKDTAKRAAFELGGLGPIDYARSFIRSTRYVKSRMQAQLVALAERRSSSRSAAMHPDMPDPLLPNNPAI